MFDFPESWVVGQDVSKWIDSVVDWVIVNWDPFFDLVNSGVLGFLGPIEDFLRWLPWWLVVVATGVAAWRVIGRNTAGLAGRGVNGVSLRRPGNPIYSGADSENLSEIGNVLVSGA